MFNVNLTPDEFAELCWLNITRGPTDGRVRELIAKGQTAPKDESDEQRNGLDSGAGAGGGDSGGN